MKRINAENMLEELKKREPIFHRPEFGTTCADFENVRMSGEPHAHFYKKINTAC